VLFYLLFVSIVLFSVPFLCICVLYYCHRVATQLQLSNISYHYCNITQMPDKKFSQFCNIGNLSRYLEIFVCCFARFLAEPLRGCCDVTPSLNIRAVKLKRTDRRCWTYVFGNLRYCSADRTLVTTSFIIRGQFNK
jgi:hypothetical protein